MVKHGYGCMYFIENIESNVVIIIIIIMVLTLTPWLVYIQGGKESFRFRRRSTSDAYEKGNGVGPRSPRPPYDV